MEKAETKNFKFGVDDDEAICARLEAIVTGVRSKSVAVQRLAESKIQRADDFKEYQLDIVFSSKE